MLRASAENSFLVAVLLATPLMSSCTVKVEPSSGGPGLSLGRLALFGPANIYPDVCSVYTVQMQNSSGAPITQSADTQMTLSGSGIGSFYSTSSDCSSSTTTVSIPEGLAGTQIFYKHSGPAAAAETLEVDDGGGGFDAASLDVVVAAAGASGAVDVNFDSDGKYSFGTGGVHQFGLDLALQADGKILVAGYSDTDGLIIRLDENGSLDTAFDADGIVTLNLGATENFTALAVQPDGKIVAGGATNANGTNDFLLARYLTDGSLDTTFNATGYVITPIGAAADQINGIWIQSDGKILVTGTARMANDDFAVARYNADGTLDTTFSSDGMMTLAINTGTDTPYRIRTQVDGKILVVGQGAPSLSVVYACQVVRLESDGDLDTTFDTDGIVSFEFGATSYCKSFALQSDGKIVVAGHVNPGNDNFAVARLNTNGSLDATFDGDGKVTTTVGVSHDDATSVFVQPDGKIVLTGFYDAGGGNYDNAVVRYNSDGSLDTSFSGDGKAMTSILGSTDWVTAGTLQPDGKILLVGYSMNGPDRDLTVARFWP